MTELIDLSFIKKNQEAKKLKRQKYQEYDFDNFNMNLINRTLEKIINQIDKNFIKKHQMYFFHLNYAKMKGDEYYWNNRFTVYGFASVKQKIFTIKLFLVDANGNKICPKSIHHRTLLSNFVLQINAELQNFKLQCNPESGELSFVFNVNCQFLDETSITDLIEDALQCYFEQSQAHYYILSLMEIINLPQNQFLSNIEQDSHFLKRFLREKRIENSKIKKQLNSVKQGIQIQLKSEYFQLKDRVLKIKEIGTYLSSESKNFRVQKEPNPNTLKQVYRKFKQYYKEELIFSKHLANKAKYKNYIQIDARSTSNLTNLFQSKLSLNVGHTGIMYRYQQKINFNCENSDQNGNSEKNIQLKSTEQIEQQTQKLRIWDKNSGKSYLIQLLFMRNDQAKKEEIILQKLCKVQSFLFFNQYISIENFDLLQMGYVVVNANPNRILLSQFLKNSNHTISIVTRFTLCINLLEIFYTLNLKSKITNYFPQISIKNLEISKNLCLTFKYLSKISMYPLLELVNTLSQIMFQNPISSFKQSKQRNSGIVKGDQVQDKFFGISIQIIMIKYYLLEYYHESIYLMKVQDLKANKSNRSQQSQRIDNEMKQTLLRSCQQLLVLFNHFKNALCRGYEQQLNFTQEFSDQD